MEDHHDQRVEGDECDVHLGQQKKEDNSAQTSAANKVTDKSLSFYCCTTTQLLLICHVKLLSLISSSLLRGELTVKSTKYFWLFSPTQLLTQGQWWSIFLMQRLQTLYERQEKDLNGQLLTLQGDNN